MPQAPTGVYPPVPTFFHPDGALDLDTLRHHLHRLKPTGISGVVALGSNGEAIHLTAKERATVINTAKQTISPLAVIAGASAPTVQETVENCKQAKEAGADYAIVLPPTYYSYGGRMKEVIHLYFTQVAEQSPIPLLIYNFPAVTHGIDIDADTIVALSAHPNIVGIKATDGNIGKMANVIGRVGPDFHVLAGASDVYLPALTVGAKGCVPGSGNVFPRSVVLLEKLFREGKLDEARKLQQALVLPDDATGRWFGIVGVKMALDAYYGYGGNPRAPLLPPLQEHRERVADACKEVVEYENTLAEAGQ
ncbi:uncharacterized protein VTP21DRAFT_1146 [Calcarisporiella thermophila]|uniref:uncharacterized protein n=1 Tax=Calcarisporiella thermophila TaxID=911321 RepID=UPI0037443565